MWGTCCHAFRTDSQELAARFEMASCEPSSGMSAWAAETAAQLLALAEADGVLEPGDAEMFGYATPAAAALQCNALTPEHTSGPVCA